MRKSPESNGINVSSRVRRRLATITQVVNTGRVLVVIEIIAPLTRTSRDLAKQLREDLLESDENVDSLGVAWDNIGMSNPIVKSTIIGENRSLRAPLLRSR